MKKFLVGSLLLFFVAGFAFAQSDLQVIAEVKLTSKEPITLGQLKNFVRDLEKTAGQKTTVDKRKEILDGLINQRLLLQLAEKEGIRVSDYEVNTFFNQSLSSMLGYAITEAEFAKMIEESQGKSFDQFMREQNGLSVDEYKKFIKDNLITKNYIMQKHGKELQEAVPTEAQIKQAYDVSKQEFIRPDCATLFLIAVPKQGNTSAEKAKIEALHKRVKANPKCTPDILKESSNEKSGFLATDLYAFKTEQAAQQMGITMAQLLEVFSQPINTVSNVVEMDTNFQFFVVKEFAEMKFLGLHDKIDPNHEMTVYDLLKQNLTLEFQQRTSQKIVKELIDSVKTNKNYKILKSDAELNKLLAW